MNVLVLEDDNSLRYALGEVVDQAGHTAITASGIEEAVAQVALKDIDVLVLDLMIGPEMSLDVANFAAYRRPKADVVFLTGTRLFPGAELFSLAKNTACVLRKPADFGQLVMLLGHIEASRRTTGTVEHAEEEL